MSEERENQAGLYDLMGEAVGADFLKIQRMINSLPSSDIAHLLESSPPREREIFWRALARSREADVLADLSDEVKEQILSAMDPAELAEVSGSLADDDLADILQALPETMMHQVLDRMSAQDRTRIEKVLSYPEDSAGGLMNTDVITVRPRHTLDVVLRYLRRYDKLPDTTDSLIVVSKHDEFLGILPITKMLVSSLALSVREVMETNVQPIAVDLPTGEVATRFERKDLVSAPVVDSGGHLVGRITIDDVVDVIREDADQSLLNMAGLDEDTFAPPRRAARRRAIWLGINLVTALIASSVINVFQATIDKVVALAVLMPIVASMGGVAATQTLTIMVRGLALGQIVRTNTGWLLRREMVVGILNGLLWAAVMAVTASLWFDDRTLGLIIALAMVINLVVAVLTGVLLPILLRVFSIDPALAGSVVVTTVTDVAGFMSFLGLATWFYA